MLYVFSSKPLMVTDIMIKKTLRLASFTIVLLLDLLVSYNNISDDTPTPTNHSF